MTKRAGVIGLKVIVAMTIMAFGFGGAILARPMAFLSTETVIASPGHDDFLPPATGWVKSVADSIYALGSGLMKDTDVPYTREHESFAHRKFESNIINIDKGRWTLEASYQGNVEARSHYLATGWVPVHEDYAAEAKGQWEIVGEFDNDGGERWVKVSRDGPALAPTDYDFDSPFSGNSYENRGTKSHDTPDATTGVAMDQGEFGESLTRELEKVNHGVAGVVLEFTLCVRAWHKLENIEGEEDVSLSTYISAHPNEDGIAVGWTGVLEAYDVVGTGPPHLLNSWPFGN